MFIFCIAYGISVIQSENIEKIEKGVEELEGQLVNTPLKVISEQIDEKRMELKNLYEYYNQGVMVRSRAAWFEEGERNVQYFEQLLKTNKRKSVIREIYNEEGEIIQDKNGILHVIKEFYKNLYESKDIELLDGYSYCVFKAYTYIK